MAVLEVKNLSTYYHTKEGQNQALDDLSFELNKGEMIGLIGESGCGKSTAGFSIMRMISYPGEIKKGEVLFFGKDILNLKDKEFRQILWKDIAMIPQSSMNALNPSYKIGDQIIEAIMIHYPEISKKEAEKKAKELLKSVGIDEKWHNAYPHKLSGGMKQRVIIAMALSCEPKVIISDESTTGLDVLIQAQILALLKKLQKQRQLSIIVISHDLHMVTSICDKIAIMYAGNLVEIGTTQEIQKDARHPYTKALFNSQIGIDDLDRVVESIDGVVPKLINPENKCRFYNRCSIKTDKCQKTPPELRQVSDTHYIACYMEE